MSFEQVSYQVHFERVSHRVSFEQIPHWIAFERLSHRAPHYLGPNSHAHNRLTDCDPENIMSHRRSDKRVAGDIEPVHAGPNREPGDARANDPGRNTLPDGNTLVPPDVFALIPLDALALNRGPQNHAPDNCVPVDVSCDS